MFCPCSVVTNFIIMLVDLSRGVLSEPLLLSSPRRRIFRRSLVAAVSTLAAFIPLGALLHHFVQINSTAFTSKGMIVVEVYETALLRSTRLTRLQQQKDVSGPPDVILRVHPTREYQEIRGFGGAITQASGTVWKKLKTERLRQSVIEAFFGESGIGASIARVPINSCDFAESSYSLDDVDGDVQLEHFDESLPNDEEHLLPMTRAALAVNPRLELLASPWSPPAWMKSNGDMNGNGEPRGLRADAAAAWATYISRWLSAFQKHGAAVSLLTVQNEPQAPSPWEACYYDAAQESQFVASHLGPALKAGVDSGRHAPVTLLGFDDQKDQIEQWADALLGDQPSSPFIGGMAYHWYAGDHFDRLAAAVARHPGKLFLGTEATYELTRLGDHHAPGSSGHLRWVREGVWARGEGYAHAIIGDLQAGSSGWLDWNVLLDSDGGPNHLGNTCDAPLIADADLGTVHKHPQYFFLGHFSRFMPRGSRRVEVEKLRGADGAVLKEPDSTKQTDAGGVYNLTDAVAYGSCQSAAPQAVAVKRPDGVTALVVLNCGDDEATVRLELIDGEGGKHADEFAQRTVPAHSIHTYLLGHL